MSEASAKLLACTECMLRSVQELECEKASNLTPVAAAATATKCLTCCQRLHYPSWCRVGRGYHMSGSNCSSSTANECHKYSVTLLLLFTGTGTFCDQHAMLQLQLDQTLLTTATPW
jgi:hypothetical protein